MDHYNRQSAAAVTVDPYSTYASQAAYDQSLHCEISSPNDDYWCQTCISPYSECLCYATSPVSPHQGYSSFGAAAGKNYTYAQAPYPKYNASSASSTSSYYTTSSTGSQPQASYSTIAPNTGDVKGSGYSPHVETSSKRGKRKGSMPPEEAREKRLEQNRRSQRSFRDRQARLVVDLKQKVEVLTEENQKLVGELSALGLRSPSRDSKSPGTDYSNY